MKIAVNTRLLIHNRLDGIGRFACETLKEITCTHPEHQFYFIFDRKYDERYIFSKNVTPIVISPQARHPLLYLLWFEISIPLLFSKLKPDLFLSPDGYLSLGTSVPSVDVIHDLNFEHYPADLPWADRLYYQKMFPRFARKATRLATVSEFSRNDISTRYGIDPAKIDVVYNGANDLFKPISESEKANVLKRFSQGLPYFFFVGTLHPRKNLVNLFKAFDLFKETDSNSQKLLISGAKMWWTEEIRLAYETMKYRSDVIFTGRVSDEELAQLMASAMALTYVSYFEGFGIPILEAFQCETAVITSNLTSMPEVAGEAALLVDPFSVESIRDAMKVISSDEKLRKSLINKGIKQKELFSWRSSAEKLYKTMELAYSESVRK
ncbi:MAG: glycosyltransferase family 4 protein [Bacteroidetes bacterium]|nr:glycosyltransferase family 4 protein [Bacteroidota bacterium]